VVQERESKKAPSTDFQVPDLPLLDSNTNPPPPHATSPAIFDVIFGRAKIEEIEFRDGKVATWFQL